VHRSPGVPNERRSRTGDRDEVGAVLPVRTLAWEQSEMKAIDHKTIYVAAELFEAERLLREGRDKLCNISANYPATLGKFKEQIEPLWRSLYPGDDAGCRIDLQVVACYLIAEATRDDS
jgi:hypothetical protein